MTNSEGAARTPTEVADDRARPLLMLGVGGVIALEQAATLPAVNEHVTAAGKWSREVLIPVGTRELISELAERYDIVWVSEWGANAHVAFTPALSLPGKPWPYIPAQFNKLRRIQRFAGHRPWVWVDDPLVDLDPLPEEPGGVVVRTNPSRGLVGLGTESLHRLMTGTSLPTEQSSEQASET